MRLLQEPVYRVFEFALLFVFVPLVFACLPVEKATVGVIPMLWIFSLYGYFILGRRCRFMSWPDEVATLRRYWSGMCIRLVAGGAILMCLIAWLAPERLFDAPRHNPLLWLVVMILYPLLSVIPQEYLYRRFFFARYSYLLGAIATILLSALLFGLAHAVFKNWQAVALTFAGGLIFSVTYYRSRSLLCACVEHALWGDLIFTIGLGEFFVGGSVKALFGLG